MEPVENDADLCGLALRKKGNSTAITVLDGSPKGSQCTDLATMATPPQKHLFLDNNVKEEPQTVYDGGRLINRFDVICRFCLNENECMLDIFESNDCVVEMTEALVAVKMDADDMLPRQICTKCYQLLIQCSAFKQQVVSSDAALRRCINRIKPVEIKSQIECVEASKPRITEHRVFDATSTTNEVNAVHKFEDLMDEECTPDNEMVCEKDSTLYSAYEEIPIEADDDAVDYMTEIKAETTTNHSDFVGSPPSMTDKTRTSVKCDQCSKEFSSSSILQKHIKFHAVEKLQYQCSVCSESFSRQAILNSHMSTHESLNEGAEEPTNIFKCTKCDASFDVEHDLYIHGSIHPDDDVIRCRQCGDNFINLEMLDSHLKKHFEDKPINCEDVDPHYGKHVCKDCGKCFFNSNALSSHQRSHTGGKPYKCSNCPKTFQTSSGLNFHVRICTGETPYKCSHCSKPFGNPSSLAIHVRRHTGEKPFKCSHCAKPYGSPSALAFHVETHTGKKPYNCSHCSKAFQSPSRLAIHARTHTGEKPYKCSLCPKSFGTASALTVHTHLHTDEKSFVCPHCSKTFRKSTSLTEHVRLHTGEKPYKCSTCPLSFCRSASLAIHIRTHTGEKLFKCSHCLKSYVSSSALVDHVRSHTGEKPYKCRQCSKSFARPSKLAVHTRAHTGEKPFECPHCSKTYQASPALAKHVRTHVVGQL